MSIPLVYLCGPIDGETEDAARGWRIRAANLLAPEFGVLDPVRGQAEWGEDYGSLRKTLVPADIVTRDLTDIDHCRAVLRFRPHASEGSSMEHFYAAHVRRLPVVVFGHPAVPLHPSIWLEHHSVHIEFGGYESGLVRAVEFLKHRYLYPNDYNPETRTTLGLQEHNRRAMAEVAQRARERADQGCV